MTLPSTDTPVAHAACQYCGHVWSPEQVPASQVVTCPICGEDADAAQPQVPS